MDDYEELTKEELERERAAAKRRKSAARELRRKQRIKRALISWGILFLATALIITGIVKMISGIWKHFQKDKTPDKVTVQQKDSSTEESTKEAVKAKIDDSILAQELPADRETALAILQAQAETDSEIKGVYDNAAVYPDKVLQCLAVNSEMKQFAMNYPAKISVVFDGNFNVDVSKSEVPLFLQFDEQWGYADYGSSVIGINGCGPTCLSMAYTYLKQDGSMNPIKVADFSTSSGYLGENGDTYWALMTDGARTLGLTSEELSLSRDNIVNALEDGKVIVCSMNPGDFTKTGHFILIRAYNDGLFYVNDPNSKARSSVGWDYDRLSSQISNMWALGAGASDSTTENSLSPDTSEDGTQPDTQSSDTTQTDNTTDN